MSITNRLASNDLAASIRLSDERKAENTAARTRMRANPELQSVLLADTRRRGGSEIDWSGYFSRAGVL